MSSRRKSKSSVKSAFITVVVLIILSYFIYLLISVQGEIAGKDAEYNAILAEKENVLEENDKLSHYISGDDNVSYIEEIAREKLDYAYPEERIYYVVPSN